MARAERESFYDAQRRHRRSGWRFSVLSGAAVLLLGVPLSVIVSPFVAAAGLVTMDVVNLVVPTPDPLEDLRDLADDVSEANRQAEADGEPVDMGPVYDEHTGDLVLVAVLMIVPGMVTMLVVWLCVRRLFLRAGAGAVALATGARPPRPGELEERQLVNLVEEMAIAAGVPPPRVLVLDAPEPNAAVVGRSKDDATIIVPRGLLDDLGRAPTGAVVADMLAVIVNGDLRVALVLASVFQTFDVVGAVLAAPFSKQTRRVLWRTLRLALRRPSRRGDGTEEAQLAVELSQVGGGFGGEDDDIGAGCVRTAFQFPFFVASIAFVLTRLLIGGFFVSPIMAALWRRRRLLADATAVELTRDPDDLARALDHFRSHRAGVPPGPWTHLFAVGPEVGRERVQRRMAQRRDEIWSPERPAGESRLGSFSRRSRAALAASSDFRAELKAADAPAGGHEQPVGEDLATFLPPLGKRLARLAAMGATIAADPDRPPRHRVSLVGTALIWVAGLGLLAVLLVLFVCLFGCLAAFVYMAIMFELALVAPLVLLSHALLR